MRIGHHEPYDADKGSNRERRAVGAFAKRRDCAIAPRGAGDAEMDASEEDRGEDQGKAFVFSAPVSPNISRMPGNRAIIRP